MIRTIYILLLLSLSYSATLYVPSEYSTIQSAIDAASEGDSVLVSADTYVENINFNGKNIVVQGEDRETTIIDGGQNGSVVIFENGESNTTTLSSFSIINGSGYDADDWGYEEFEGGLFGGGIYINNSSPILIDLIVSNNFSKFQGGGIYAKSFSGHITNTKIVNNHLTQGPGDWGGGICIINSTTPLLSNTIISNNVGHYGGGIAIRESSPKLENVLINHNMSYGSGREVYFSFTEADFNHVTIFTNITEENYCPSCASLFSYSSSSININNSIIWHNGNFEVSASNIEIIYSDIKGGWEGEANFDADPLFCDVENGDFTVQSDSPVLGTGQDGADMGAFGVGCEPPIYGCTGESSCNYNPDATVDDGSCIYPDDHHDCDGNCLVELDCAGNCCVIGEEGCYWQETGPCGEEGPNNGTDSCGVCGGDNTSCADCAGVPCSDAYVDNCGICDDIPENDCIQDCAGTWGGDAVIDECDVCGGDNTSCQQLGDLNGDGTINVIDIVMAVDLILNDNYDLVGDVNEDGQLNVIDIVMLVDWVLNGMPEMDSDGDGVLDEDDSDPNNPYQCSDLDGDTCDDCSTGTFNPSDDGYDYDGDGQCDDGDCDDDNDGCQECWDYCP